MSALNKGNEEYAAYIATRKKLGSHTHTSQEITDFASAVRALAGKGITALSGDVTASGQGVVVATISPQAVTVGKMYASETDILFGRASPGAGAGEQIRCTPFVRTILDDQDAASVRATIGAGMGGGDALRSDPLSQFAFTTSLQLAGIITDETGSDALVFANSPDLTGVPTAPTAALGTSTTQLATTAFVQGVALAEGDKGDITVTASGATWTIDAGVVTLAKLANIASPSFLGRITAGAGAPEELTGTQATTLLDVFTATLKGLVPFSNGGGVYFLRADGAWEIPQVADGDKGDITVTASGTVWTIDAGVVSLAKMADMATASFLGRNTAGTGVPEALSIATAKTMLNLTGTNSGDQTITLTGDVSGSGTGSFATTIGVNKVTLGMMAQMATDSFLGRDTAGTGNVEVLSVATVKTLLNLTGTNSGDQTITLTGDVTGSGTGSFGTTIGANKVTLAMMANMATLSVLGRDAAGTGVVQVITAENDFEVLRRNGADLAFGAVDLGQGNAVTGTLAAIYGGTGQPVYAVGDLLYASTTEALSKLADVGTGSALISGGVDVAPSWGKIGLTTHMGDIVTARIIGRVTAGTGVPEALTGTQATTLLDVFTATLKGLVPFSNGGTVYFLRADGAWEIPQVADGDKGDITVTASGATWTIDPGVVTLAKMANMATLSVIGRSTAGAGVPQIIDGTANQVLRVDSAGTALDFGQVNLASSAAVTGTLVVANGGTGAATFTAGRILFGAGTSAINTSANLFWDNGNSRLGLGTASPFEQLELTGNLRIPVTTSTTGQIKMGADRFIHNFGAQNAFFGFNAGNFSTSGTGYNLGLGWKALEAITTGWGNTACGANVMPVFTTGLINAGLGLSALARLTTGSGNNAMGADSLSFCTSGSYNNSMGQSSLYNLTIGSFNTGVGAGTGKAITTATYCTFIGAAAGDTDLVTTTTPTLNYACAIGAFAQVQQDNCIILGGSQSAYACRVGIARTTATAWLHLPAGNDAPSGAPLKFTPTSDLLITPEVGAVEVLDEDVYITLPGPARKRFVLADPPGGLSLASIPVATTDGRLTESADLQMFENDLIVFGSDFSDGSASLAGGVHVFLDNGTAFLSAGSLELNANGKIVTHNAIATEGWGIPSIVDDVALTGQVANIASTNFTNAGTAGTYRLGYYLVCTTSAAGAGSISLSVTYNDGSAARTLTGTAVVMTATNRATTFTNTESNGTLIKLGSGSIAYSVTVTGIYSTAVYALYVTLERLS